MGKTYWPLDYQMLSYKNGHSMAFQPECNGVKAVNKKNKTYCNRVMIMAVLHHMMFYNVANDLLGT